MPLLIFYELFQEDNSFTVQGLSSGSYLIEVACPDYYYEPVRVDINSKGKIRARKVSNVQPSQVISFVLIYLPIKAILGLFIDTNPLLF